MLLLDVRGCRVSILRRFCVRAIIAAAYLRQDIASWSSLIGRNLFTFGYTDILSSELSKSNPEPSPWRSLDPQPSPWRALEPEPSPWRLDVSGPDEIVAAASLLTAISLKVAAAGMPVLERRHGNPHLRAD